MSYANMTPEERTSMLRESEDAADELRNGKLQPKIDEWKAANPNAPTDYEYNYSAAAQNGALPDNTDEEAGTLSPDFQTPDYESSGTFNAGTGKYEYETPTEESALNTWLYKQDKKYILPEGEVAEEDAVVQDIYMGVRTGIRAGQLAVKHLTDMFVNEPEILSNKFELRLMRQNLEILDRKKAMLDPEYYERETARLREKIDPVAVNQAWDDRSGVTVVRPIDYKDEIASEMGAWIFSYLNAKGAMKGIEGAGETAAKLLINPAKLNKYLNATVVGLKEIAAGMYADKGMAYAADWHENLTSMLNGAIEARGEQVEGTGEDSPYASVGEFLENIGIESESLMALDASETDSDLERGNIFAAEGGILSILFPAVLRGVFGAVQLPNKLYQGAKVHGFPTKQGMAAQNGMVDLKPMPTDEVSRTADANLEKIADTQTKTGLPKKDGKLDVAALRAESAANNAPDDYRIPHSSPVPEGKNSLDDMSDIYGDDVYGAKGAQYYGTGNRTQDQQTINILSKVKGKPDADITVYRAVPKDAPDTINAGDWITVNRGYAKDHGEGPMYGDYKIISQKVKVGDVFTNGDSLHEQGYHPQ